MNIRKPIDYNAMFAALDTLMAAKLPQMKLYCEIGQLVSSRAEKGAAVAAAEYLQGQYPEASGFSPRNVRRMRDFYRLYEGSQQLMEQALCLNWTQNTVIMEASLSVEDRAWYLRACAEHKWSKSELQSKINSDAHLDASLDQLCQVCHSDHNGVQETRASQKDDHAFCLSPQYMNKPDIRIYTEGPGGVGRTGGKNSNFLCCPPHLGNRHPDPLPRSPQTDRALDRVQWELQPPTDQPGVRPPHRHEPGNPPQCIPHLRLQIASSV